MLTGAGKGLSEIAVISGPTDKTLWLDYLPKFVVCGAGSPQFVAVSTEEGCLNVYSPAGRRCVHVLPSATDRGQTLADAGARLAVLAAGGGGTLSHGHHRPRHHLRLEHAP